jgi:hypothetical protein
MAGESLSEKNRPTNAPIRWRKGADYQPELVGASSIPWSIHPPPRTTSPS